MSFPCDGQLWRTVLTLSPHSTKLVGGFTLNEVEGSLEQVPHCTVGGVKSGICRLSRALCGARCVNMKSVKSAIGPG